MNMKMNENQCTVKREGEGVDGTDPAGGLPGMNERKSSAEQCNTGTTKAITDRKK